MFVGGSTAGLLLTDSAAEGIRATKDVDAIVEAATLRQCYELEARLPALGFVRDIESDVICRWRHAATGVLFDLMPIDPAILGFSNRWYPEAARTAIRERLSDRVEIRRIAAPAFIATKLEAFVSRGRGDFLSSQLRSSVALLCMLTLAGCAYARRSGADTQSFRAERNREAGVLIAHATPSDLAAAGLLIAPDDSNAQQPLDLIERAQKLAPQRPDFVWVNLAICERFKCGARAQIAAHLQALDPDNGFAWASDLEGAHGAVGHGAHSELGSQPAGALVAGRQPTTCRPARKAPPTRLPHDHVQSHPVVAYEP